MTEAHKLLLEGIAKQLGGELYTVLVSDKNKEHKKIVIEYGHQRKTNV